MHTDNDLVDVDPQVFAILVHWIYYNNIKNDKDQRPDLVTCAKLWVLGDRFLMRKMQNDTMKHIYNIIQYYDAEIGETAFGEFSKIAADFNQEDNPLFRIVVKKMIITKEENFKQWLPAVPRSVLLRVSLGLKSCERKMASYDKPAVEKWGSDATLFFVKE